VPSHLFDPAKAHQIYNDTLDELEYAAAVGFDGICVNEHHQNAYGYMPSPNIMAASLARRTKDVALIVMGNSIALYDPPICVAEDGDARLHQRPARGLRLPHRHQHGHELRVRLEPGADP